MNRIIASFLLFSVVWTGAFAQKYFTEEAHLHFFSAAPLEDIEADSHRGRCVIDSESGKMQWSIDVRTFDFEKELMEEHFNENYIESHKYPKATFTGEIVDGEVDWNTDGTYTVSVEGTMDLHGVQKPHSASATITVAGDTLQTKSTFILVLKDYKIKIPKIVIKNIAEEVEVTVDAQLEVLASN